MITRIKKDNDYFIIITSCDIDKLKKMSVCKDFNKILKRALDNINIENYVCNLLHCIGLPSNMKGYKYIKDILVFLYESNVDCCMSKMYEYLSAKFKSKKSSIERDIAHSIKTCFNRGDIEVINDIFGHTIDFNKGNPTNKEFICTIYDKLKIDFKKV